MPVQSAIMPAHTRSIPDRVDRIEHCRELDDPSPSPVLSGWRLGLSVAIVAAVLGLAALPVVTVFDPSVAGLAAGWLGRLAAVVPVMTGVQALVFVVAIVVVSRPDARP